jgi:nicotinamide phosphoribosyltransferase
MSFKPTPSLMCDFYKTGHRPQYPDNTEIIYGTWTPRSNRYFPAADKVITIGPQMFAKNYLIDYFNENFFDLPKEEMISQYSRIIKNCLGIAEPETKHIEDLHDLGYLPVLIKSLPEGTPCPIRVPMLTIQNTDPRFFWVTNFLETLMSSSLWISSTSATIAKHYRTILDKYAMETVGNTDFVPFQGHDFSMRGMSFESGYLSGIGHLVSFVGTDTIPAIQAAEYFYGANVEEELVGCSIAASEHSVMCAGGDGDGEFETYRRLIQDVYPSGFVSLVSDTWDLWHVLTDTLPKLKKIIMDRDGKVVIRPDSGDPVDIICGNTKEVKALNGSYWDIIGKNNYATFEGKCYQAYIGDTCVTKWRESNLPENKGVIELLWDVFGGTVNDLGFKELDPHIGAIYGDAITPERATQICERLKAKGFASTNVVFGIGSYTYQYNTRDTFGFALKSTACVINGEEKAIYKDPITDDGTKKSQTGKVAVVEVDGELTHIDGLSLFEEHPQDELVTIFEDGRTVCEWNLAGIRARAKQ